MKQFSHLIYLLFFLRKFGFIGSYLGAIGTIVLGYIAFYQNKRYKELSDQSEQNFLELQEEIKELTKKSVFLIDLKLTTVGSDPMNAI